MAKLLTLTGLGRHAVLPLALAVTVSGCASGHSGPQPYPLAAPATRSTTPGLPRWIGQVAVVDLNVPLSIAASAQEASLSRAAEQAGPYRVAFLRLIEDINSVRVVKGTAQGHVVSYPSAAVLAQAKGARLLAAVGLPTCLIVDREGRIAARIVGVVDPGRLIASIRAVEAEG